MRIIGGIYGGRKLTEFENIGVRPTSDMVRESLFNILRDRITNARFLDLFCGTGAVGIEAISRGAEHVFFNDNSKKSLDCLQKNLKNLKIDGGYSVSLMDGLSFLENTTEKFDVIYIDPPYDSGLGEKAVILAEKCLNAGGVIVYESDSAIKFDFDKLCLKDTRKYGRNVLYFFEKKQKACVFAGTFDPVTRGHESIVYECLNRFQEVIVTLGVNENKTPYFSETERMEFLRLTFTKNSKITIINFSEHKEDYNEILKEKGVNVFVRGIRNDFDAVYENSRISVNKKLYPNISTMFIKADKKFKNVSSSLVKECIEKGKDVTRLVPEACAESIKKAISIRTAQKK